VSPAKPVLYSDEGALRVVMKPMSNQPNVTISQTEQPKEKLTIRIPPHPRLPEPLPQTQLVLNIPDYPQGTTRSGKL
jgi:hypothetical protein